MLFTGEYTHAVYEGEVENVVENARLSAILLLVAALLQFTWPCFSPLEADHHFGFWIAGGLAVAAFVWVARRLLREPSPDVPRRPPEELPSWLR